MAAPIDLGIDDLGPATRVATGGSATVYRAHQARFGRDVAVKVFHDRDGGDERVAAERLALGAASANAGAVTVLADGVTAAGEPFLLFPWFERGSLHHWVRRHGPLPLGDAVFLLQPVADTLADLHAAGLAHRDVKPGNILLTDRFRPRLTDFGVATAIGATAGYAFTPGYGAPEAAPGMPPVPVDATLDVHGFGASLHFVLTGRSPDEPTTGSEHSELPAPVAELLAACLAHDPGERPPDGSALAALLRRAARESEQCDQAPGEPSTERPSCATQESVGVGVAAAVRDRWPWLLAAGGGALAAVGVLF